MAIQLELNWKDHSIHRYRVYFVETTSAEYNVRDGEHWWMACFWCQIRCFWRICDGDRHGLCQLIQCRECHQEVHVLTRAALTLNKVLVLGKVIHNWWWWRRFEDWMSLCQLAERVSSEAVFVSRLFLSIEIDSVRDDGRRKRFLASWMKFGVFETHDCAGWSNQGERTMRHVEESQMSNTSLKVAGTYQSPCGKM